MKFGSVRLVPLLLTSFLFTALNGITACGGGTTSGSPATTYTLSVSPQPVSMPVSSTMTFTATTNDPSDQVTWQIIGNENCADCANLNLGSPASAEGATFVYTAPPTPPIYGEPIGTINGTLPQGSVLLRVLDLKGGPMVQFAVAITAPTITTGLLISNDGLETNTVALGKTLDIEAYAAGSTNNAITMQVNGITNGSTTYGTITPTTNYGSYTYTAPATMPATGNTVTIKVISVADPTKSTSMTITLTS